MGNLRVDQDRLQLIQLDDGSAVDYIPGDGWSHIQATEEDLDGAPIYHARQITEPLAMWLLADTPDYDRLFIAMEL